MTEWKLWFIQLSGWPVFLVVVGIVCLASLGLSVLLTRLGDRSVVWSAILALIAVAIVIACAFGLLALASRM